MSRRAIVPALLVLLILGVGVLAYVAGAITAPPREVVRIEHSRGREYFAGRTLPYGGGWSIDAPPAELYMAETVDA